MSYMSKLKSRLVAALLAVSAMTGTAVVVAQKSDSTSAAKQQETPKSVALPEAPKPQKSSTSEGNPGAVPGVMELKPDKPDYSQEAVIVEKLDRALRFENDGTGSSTTTARFKVQTQAGVQQLGQLVFGYNSAIEKLEIVYVKVTRPDGSNPIFASKDNEQDVPSQIEREAPSYTDYRERHITVPALRAGETLEYQIKTTIFAPLIPKHFWFEHVFRKEIITLSETLSINFPKSREVKLKNKPSFEAESREDSDRKTLTWTSNYLKRESKEELKKKRRREAREDWRPDIQFSTFKNWEELGEWYAGIQQTQFQPTPELKAKVAELTKDTKSEEEKIRNIYDYVAQGYRYVSLSFGVGRYQPHSASEIFANKYGDCKDKHTLLSTMLKEAGFKVEPVLISSNRKLDPEVPSPSQFDHVISYIHTANGGLWADTTTEIAPFGMLTYNIRKKDALLVGLGNKSRIIETPANPPFQSTQLYAIEGTISEIGKLKGSVASTMRGDQELGLRMAFRNTPENKWKDVAEYIAYTSGIGGEVDGVKVENLTNTHEPMKLSFNVSKPNFLDWSSKKTDLDLPLPKVGLVSGGMDAADDEDDNKDTDDDAKDAAVSSAPEKDPKTDKPIQLGSPFDLKVNLKLQLPSTHKLRAPVPISVKRDYAEYKSTYKVEGNTLLVERMMTLKQRELPADRRSDYQAFVRSVRADENQKLFVESLAAATGAPKLPDEIKVEELLDSARAAYMSQNYRVALDLLKRATEKEPKNKIVWNMLGEAHMGLRNFTDAEAAYRKQIQLDAFDQYAYNNLGRALFSQRRMEEAIPQFQKQLEINPLDLLAHASLGEIYMELHKYDLAAESMERAVSIDPKNAFNHANLGRALVHLKKDKEALESFDKAVEIEPSPMLWNNIAYEMAEANSNLDKAEQYAESAVSSTASALRNVSVDRMTMRDVFTVSSLASYWDTLGWIAYKRGNLDKAEKYIKAAWAISQSGEVGDHLGQIAEKRGKKDDAIMWYAQSLSAERPEIETSERLAKLTAKDQVEALKKKHQPGLEQQRTVSFKAAGKKGKADFFVSIAPGVTQNDVKFIAGDESLKTLAESLKTMDFKFPWPDNSPAKVVRRGTANCSGESCSITFAVQETITSVD